MRTFWLLALAGFRRHSTYRLALLAGMTTNSVFGILRAHILLAALASAGTSIGGYDASMTVAFVWWGQALLGAVNLWGFREITIRVRTGDIAVDFLRPVDPQLAYLASDLGRAAINGVARGAPALLVGALLFQMAWPSGVLNWVAGLVALVLGVIVAFCGSFIVNLAAFWVIETRGLLLTWNIVAGFLCGLYLPVWWFPGWLQTVATWSPFPSMLQHPLDILTGRVVGVEVWTTLLTQLVWVAVLGIVGQVVLRAGRRRLVVQGG